MGGGPSFGRVPKQLLRVRDFEFWFGCIVKQLWLGRRVTARKHHEIVRLKYPDMSLIYPDIAQYIPNRLRKKSTKSAETHRKQFLYKTLFRGPIFFAGKVMFLFS